MIEMTRKPDAIELVDMELGATIKIVARPWDSPQRELWKKTRVHVWGVENLPELVIEDLTLPEPAERGDDPANDKAYDRRNRLYGRKQCEVAQVVLERVAELAPELKDQLENVKFRFSRVAGCSCGCSPGVVVSEALRMTGRPVDVYITLAEPVELAPEV